MFFLAYLVEFLGQLHITRNYVFTVNTSAEQLPLQSKQFDTTVSEQLLLQSSYFSRTLVSSQQLFFQNSYLFGAKLLPTSYYFLRIGSFLGQLVFQNSYYLGRQICSECRYLQKSFFFEVHTSTKYQIFQNNCFFNKVTSYFRKQINFFRKSNRT